MLTTRLAINFELPQGDAPDWVQLLPPGPVVAGIDGRVWILDQQSDQSILTLFQQHRRVADLPIDWEHATELRAPQGLEAPAAGWIDQIERRDDGSWWGHAGWTEKALQQIAAREYRYVSPVILYTEDRRIVGIDSVGLTNKPNLPLAALNSEDRREMTIATTILTALGLASTADETAVVTAIEALKIDRDRALNRAETPEIAKFVPRADYDAVLLRATNAEQLLQQHRQQERAKEIDTAIQQALTDGKITPATETFYRGVCQRDGGLDDFKIFIAAAVPVVTRATGDTAKPPTGSALADADPKDAEGFKAACQAEWDRNGGDVRKEFGTFATYHAFQKADAQGLVRIKGERK